MSGRGRGRGGSARDHHFRAYDEYDDAYASPRTRASRGQQQYAERHQRQGLGEGHQYHDSHYSNPNSARDSSGPPSLSNGQHGMGPRRRSRAPYAAGPYNSLAPAIFTPRDTPRDTPRETPRDRSGNIGSAGRQQQAGGASGGRPRAPYTSSPAAFDTPALGLPAAAPRPSASPEPEAPSNPHFMSPLFPQPPRTRTDSCSAWALMVEAGCQALEGVVGPFLEGALQELFGECWERELHVLGLPLPPLSAASCAELVGRCKGLQERLPITIHKRVEALSKACCSLSSSPGSLEPEDVAGAQAAMKGMLQDCVKAMRLPSLLGAGSRQFRSFTCELLPHAESALLYFDMLAQDCSEAAAARQQARALEAGGDAACAAVLVGA